MAFEDIPLGKFLKIEDGETEIVVFVGEPELVKNSFGELGMEITTYHLDKGEWWCRTWGMSPKTSRSLRDKYIANGNKWPANAFEVTRVGEKAQTVYLFKESTSITAPKGLEPLGKAAMESRKWERPNIPASASDAAQGADAVGAKNAAMRLKYRMLYTAAESALQEELAKSFGDPEGCAEDKLAEAIAYAKL